MNHEPLDARGNRRRADAEQSDCHYSVRAPFEAIFERFALLSMTEVVDERDRAQRIHVPDRTEGDEHDAARRGAEHDRDRAGEDRPRDAELRDPTTRLDRHPASSWGQPERAFPKGLPKGPPPKGMCADQTSRRARRQIIRAPCPAALQTPARSPSIASQPDR